MTKNERQIYKSGRKNKNAYNLSPFTNKERRIIYISVIFLVFGLIVTALDICNILTWNDVKRYAGIVDGVEPANSNFAVYYLDVGQSDCTVVVCDDEVLMIDCGTYNQANTIRRSLKTLNIETVDYMVITHQHSDHFGSATTIIENWNVENVIMPQLSSENVEYTLAYNDLLRTLYNYNEINTIISNAGYKFNIGSAVVEILSPSKQDDNLNNMSIVLKITYGKTSFLFQGDAESEIEKDLIHSHIDLKSDVLKLGHHGSNTSSTEEYIKEVSPEFVIISCGSDNHYKHPYGELIDRLEYLGFVPYITSYNGHITATSDGETVAVTKQFEDAYFR